jgi:predicted membrane-bound mannosyltransferase
MILLAGIGAAAWFRSARAFVGKGTAMVVLAGACTFLAWEAWRSSYVACEDPDNPYVYAHPTRDVLDLVQHIVRLADCQGQGQQLPIQVICVDDDYWPLPWYLRSFPNVGWFHRIPEGKPAPLIIVQPQMEPELIRFLYERQPPGERNLYVPATPAGQRRPWQLRPFVPLRPYVPLELWQSFLTGKQP